MRLRPFYCKILCMFAYRICYRICKEQPSTKNDIPTFLILNNSQITIHHS